MRNDFGAGDVFAPYTARHAARRGRIEIILRKEAARNVRGQYFPVEEQRASVGVLGGKFDVVRDGQNGHSAAFQFFEKRGERRFLPRVETLCRLIEKQDLRLGQQAFRERAFLLFAAAEIERMFFEQMRYADLFGDPRNALLPFFFGQTERLRDLGEIFSDFVADKDGLRVLGQ